MKPHTIGKQTRIDQFLTQSAKRQRLDATISSAVPSLISAQTISLQEQQRSYATSRRPCSPSPPLSPKLPSHFKFPQFSEPGISDRRDKPSEHYLKRDSQPTTAPGESRSHPSMPSPPAHEVAAVADPCIPHTEPYVVFPWSEQNTCKGDNGHKCKAWVMVDHILREDTSTSTVQLKGLMQALLVHYPMSGTASNFGFEYLCRTIDTILSDAERQHFFAEVLPWMKRVAYNGPKTFTEKQLKLLCQGNNNSVYFTHEEAVTLMCCSFFSLFPGRNHVARRSRNTCESDATPLRFGISRLLPSCNFHSLFCATDGMRRKHREPSQLQKIRCVLQYFFYNFEHAAQINQPGLEFNRVCYDCFPTFSRSTSPLCDLTILMDSLIESDHGALQMDFANRWIGGGVLEYGCVQEEIRLVVSPELLLSRLICEVMGDSEVVFMSGAAQYSEYTGYSDSFSFVRGIDVHANADGKIALIDETGCSPIRDICVVASDAVSFRKFGRIPIQQYYPSWVIRETNKAFVSFNGTSEAALSSAHTGPIATGNWGCGAYAGDVQLKLLIQWCAASEAGRDIRYYAFDKTFLRSEFESVKRKIVDDRWTVGDVFTVILSYDADAPTSVVKSRRAMTQTVFEYLLGSSRPSAPS